MNKVAVTVFVKQKKNMWQHYEYKKSVMRNIISLQRLCSDFYMYSRKKMKASFYVSRI